MVTQLDLFGNHVDVQAKDPIWILKNRPAPDPNSPIVVSYGGGTNSTAMLIAMVLKGIKPDLILFADTGGELPETYEWVNTFSDWLEKQGFPGIEWVKYVQSENISRRKFTYSTLEEECLATNGLPSKAYGMATCSMKWKVQPIRRRIKQYCFVHNIQLTPRQFTGIHAGEVNRLLGKSGKIRELEQEGIRQEYPLVEWGLNQENCNALIKSVGLPVPSKSSCFFCPNRKISEIIELKEKHPDLYRRAINIEQNAELHSLKGLGRTKYAWSEIGQLTPLQKALIEAGEGNKLCACVD
jgi:hypothetical protein